MTSWVPFDLLDHLWQSTLFTAAVWLVTRALKTNAARVRYWLWLAASVKFLIPLSLLVSFGERFAWRTAAVAAPPAVSSVIEQVLTPAAASVAAAAPAAPIASTPPITWAVVLVVAWGLGVAFVLSEWWRQWRPIRRALRDARPIDLDENSGLTVLASSSMIEPGVFGIWRPVLLVPDGIRDRLTPAQLRALIAHERCHVQHHDNLTAALHMAIEVVFWFHPLVWWLERRLIEERERACDEYVLQSGSTPRDYAEGILEVCRFAKDPSPVFVAGITGSDLRRRIESILQAQTGRPLSAQRAVALAVCAATGVLGPVTAGAVQATKPAQTAAADRPRFEVASIKPCQEPPQQPGRIVRSGENSSPGRLSTGCVPLLDANGIGLISDAYATFADGHLDIDSAPTPFRGGPSWLHSARYEINAKAEGSQSVEMMMGPMMQVLLEDRFQLKIHRETTEGPIYVLSAAREGPKLQPFTEGSCTPYSTFPPPALQPGQQYCRMQVSARSPASLDAQGVTLDSFSRMLRLILDRPVIDKTGIAGRFDIRVEFSREGTNMAAMPVDSRPAASDTPGPPSIFTVLQEQLGLRLEPSRGPVDTFVIDSIELPTEN